MNEACKVLFDYIDFTSFSKFAFVVGIPVAFAILRFALVIPSARFQLKESPGILKEDFLAISNYAPS